MHRATPRSACVLLALVLAALLFPAPTTPAHAAHAATAPALPERPHHPERAVEETVHCRGKDQPTDPVDWSRRDRTRGPGDLTPRTVHHLVRAADASPGARPPVLPPSADGPRPATGRSLPALQVFRC
ncbi:hypothetical protein [Streptomyces zhihengii]|uniref:Ig-like domain-containing protein n=1 Tax=Streptomyces zhihengii TaxID=1818004 RepID=A0ABS2UU86_9ACTN|nr:hypothetical protein [Streptomyces zhihengii]MBM9621049.1 hypothetical protein [Streptomyces zhihengii]